MNVNVWIEDLILSLYVSKEILFCLEFLWECVRVKEIDFVVYFDLSYIGRDLWNYYLVISNFSFKNIGYCI